MFETVLNLKQHRRCIAAARPMLAHAHTADRAGKNFKPRKMQQPGL